MIDFICGVIIGVAGLFIIALHFSNKAAKAKQPEQPQGVAAVSMNMNCNNGGIASLDVYHQRLMRDIIERIEGRA